MYMIMMIDTITICCIVYELVLTPTCSDILSTWKLLISQMVDLKSICNQIRTLHIEFWTQQTNLWVTSSGIAIQVYATKFRAFVL